MIDALGNLRVAPRLIARRKPMYVATALADADDVGLGDLVVDRLLLVVPQRPQVVEQGVEAAEAADEGDQVQDPDAELPDPARQDGADRHGAGRLPPADPQPDEQLAGGGLLPHQEAD